MSSNFGRNASWTGMIVTFAFFLAFTVAGLAGASQLGAQTVFDAARTGDVETIAALLDTDPELIHATDEDGETPLHSAAWLSRYSVATVLLERGADIEARNNWGRTPLLIVARETGNAKMAALLIEAGAEVNVRDRGGESPLDLAAWRGFAELVDLLLDEGAELPPPGSTQGQYVAMFAAEKGLDRLFGMSVDAGVDLGLRNENDGSLLHSASQGGSAEVVARLLDEGFDPTERDVYGREPLHYAAEMGHQDIARLLLDRGAGIDARSLSGETAFNTAEWVERAEMAKWLSAAGASTEARRFPELTGSWLDPDPPPPGAPPRRFAAVFVSTHRFLHGTIAFAPDMDEAYWSSQVALQETGYSQGLLMHSRLVDGRWTVPAPATFTRLGWGDDVPFYAPDGDRLFFLSGRPAPGESQSGAERIWHVTRTANGWSEPEIVTGGPNLVDLHWQFSVASDRSLYVASRGELYVSRLKDGRYQEVESLGDPINSESDEAMPFIAPDGSYLLFTRFGHPENHGFADLWISFPDGDGGWTEPTNLGPSINAVAGICPIITPDGEYLLFNAGGDDFWVDAGFIEEMREELR